MKLFLSLMIASLFVNIGCTQPSTDQKLSKRGNVMPFSEFKMSNKMDDAEFWKIIDYSKNVSAENLEKQSGVIAEKLSAYKPEEIVEFEIILTKKLIAANSYKTLAANRIIDSWISDDGFLYFKCWLVSLGQKVFENALNDPNSLADVVEKGVVPDFESLLYVSTDAYKKSTGKHKEDESFPRNVAFNKGLNYESGGSKITGEDWTEKDLPKLYPKLWAKFN